MLRRCLAPALALVVAASVGAQARDDKSSHAGYVDSAWTKSVTDKEPSVQVMLDPPLLKLVASASKESDADLNAIISQLAFVRVNVYENLTTEGSKLAEAVDSQVKALTGKGWSTVAKVREDGQRVDVLMKTQDDKIVGFVVLVAGDGDLVFVNMAGDIEPEKFGEKLGKVVTKVSGGEIKIEGLSGLLDSVKSSEPADESKPEKDSDDDDKGHDDGDDK